MSPVANNVERDSFSVRLCELLKKNDLDPHSPTQLARHFNVLYFGKPITVHAARKWLVGEAIPTQEKLTVLASWLGASPEYLRFGTGGGTAIEQAGKLDPVHHQILADLRRMDQRQVKLVRDFMRMVVQHNLQPVKAKGRQ